MALSPGDLADIQKKLSQINETATIQKLIENLQGRLKVLQEEKHHSGELGGGAGRPANGSIEEMHDDGVSDGYGNPLLHEDTLILLISLVFMIIFGIILRKVFMYFTQLRRHRERYAGGLRRWAEHMQAVTLTMAKPSRHQQAAAGAEMDVFRPPVRAMTRHESDVGQLTTQLDARKLSIKKGIENRP